MRLWKVYSSDGSAVKASTHEIEYNGEYMGSCKITVTFESPVPIKFDIGDYIDYRNERFYLNVVPACRKQASSGSHGSAFVYESVIFNSCSDELSRCDFLDIVLEEDNKIHWTALPTFSFTCESVADLARRIQANLDRCYGKDTWAVQVDPAYTGTKEVSISVDKQTVWDALSLVDSEFKTNFVIRDRTITIGTLSSDVNHTFRYGIGNGLTSFERTVDDSQKVITRLRAYGNTTNVPTSYYKYVSFYIECRAYITATSVNNYITWGGSDKYTITRGRSSNKMNASLLIIRSKWAQDSLSYRNLTLPDIVEEFGTSGTTATIKYKNATGEEVSLLCYIYRNDEFFTYGDDDSIFTKNSDGSYRRYYIVVLDQSFHDAVSEGTEVKISISSYDTFNYSHILASYKETVNHDNYPNNMAVTRLMLPGFPIEKGEKDCGYIDELYSGYKLVYDENDVYIDSPNMATYGLREGSVYIDGTDNETTDFDVYPSIEDMTYDDLKAAGFNVEKKSDDNGNLDELAYDAVSVSTGKPVADDGDTDVDSALQMDLFVWIKDIGFNIKNYVDTQTPLLHMKSGMCVGREFEIKNCIEVTRDDVKFYRLTITRVQDNDTGFVYPNTDFPMVAGDEFVLLHIRMPDIYYKAASERLLRYALPYFAYNDVTKFAYTPQIDNLWIARQHNNAILNGGKSIYLTIKEGDQFIFDESSDLDIKGKVFISTLNIKESKDNPLPQINITLQDKKTVGTLQRMQNQITATTEIVATPSSSSLNRISLINSISDYGSDMFLSKSGDDMAEGQIIFNTGLLARSSYGNSTDNSDEASDGLIEYCE